MTWVWTIPAVAPSFNQYKRMHWAKQERVRQAFIEDAWPLLYERGNACPRPLATPVVLRAVILKPTRRRRDSDNYAAPLWKWLQDLLVAKGFLPDDTADLVNAYPPAIVVEPGTNEKTIVTITPCEKAEAADG